GRTRPPHKGRARGGGIPRSARGGPGGDLAGRVVGAAHQRAGLYVAEAKLERLDLQGGELGWGDVARDRQMVGGRPQILSDRKDLDVMRAQVAEDLDHLVDLLPQAEHDPRLGEDGGVHPLGPLQQLQGAGVAALRPNLRIEAGHRLDVVVEDVWTGLHYGGERRLVAHEVGDQHLNAAVRDPPDLPDGAGEDGGTAGLE